MSYSLKELKEFKKSLTINCTKSEKKLCKKLTELGIKYKFQHIVQPFICDFYFVKGKKVVELDSPRFHRKSYDQSRDRYLNNLGIKVLRIKSYRVFRDMPKVIEEILTFLK